MQFFDLCSSPLMSPHESDMNEHNVSCNLLFLRGLDDWRLLLQQRASFFPMLLAVDWSLFMNGILTKPLYSLSLDAEKEWSRHTHSHQVGMLKRVLTYQTVCHPCQVLDWRKLCGRWWYQPLFSRFGFLTFGLFKFATRFSSDHSMQIIVWNQKATCVTCPLLRRAPTVSVIQVFLYLLDDRAPHVCRLYGFVHGTCEADSWQLRISLEQVHFFWLSVSAGLTRHAMLIVTGSPWEAIIFLFWCWEWIHLIIV